MNAGYLDIPMSVGRVMMQTNNTGNPKLADSIIRQPAKRGCSDLFPYVNQLSNSTRKDKLMNSSYCFDPDVTVVEGVELFGARKFSEIYFQMCTDIPEDERVGVTCLNWDELISWSIENNPYLGYLSSFSFVDFTDIDEPFKQVIDDQIIASIAYTESLKYYETFTLHDVEMQDELISPFPSENN